MFGKLVKYVIAKGMKLVPNFIGRTSAQAQSDVVSEGFTLGNVVTSVSGEPTELENDGKIVEQVPAVTTPADYETPVDLTVRQFSFVPFGVFGFSPFTVFGFSPFNVFGFSPFNVFGFSPFNVFGFSPFRVFGFSPVTYSFTPYCIDQDTPVLTEKGYILAKDITMDDKLIVKYFKNIPLTNHEGIREWNSETNIEYEDLVAEIKNIKETEVFETVIVNGDKFKRFSTQEDILVLRDNKLIFIVSSELKKNDQIVRNKEQINDSELYYVEKIEIIQEKRKVYDFIREPFGLIVADSLFVYNAYPID